LCEGNHEFSEDLDLDEEWLDYCEDCSCEVIIEEF